MVRDSGRALLTVTAIGAGALGLVRVSWLSGVGPGGLPHALSTTSPTRSLPLVLALCLAGFALWLAGAVLLTLVAEVPGWAGRWARAILRRLAPAAARRMLALTLGLSVLS